MARTLETPIQKRFSDVDPFQHVNNISQQMYFDVGKMEFYEKVLGAEVLLADLRILTVSTSTSYLGQVRMHDPVRVTTTCERVGTKSLTLFQQLLAGGGSYWQKNHAAGAITVLGYGQRLRWNNVVDTGVMLNWDKRPYDGKRENNLAITLDANIRF